MIKVITVLCLAVLPACVKDNLGTSCVDAGSALAVGNARTDARCVSTVCVSTVVRSSYCSRPCRSETECPDGFACQGLKPGEGELCLLQKPCRAGVRNDCPVDRMLCRTVETDNPDQPAFYCDVKD